jgi:cytochrome c5
VTVMSNAENGITRDNTAKTTIVGQSRAWGNATVGGRQGERMLRIVIICTLAVVASTAMAQAQDLEAGKASFRKCQVCHDVGEGAKNKARPRAQWPRWAQGRDCGGLQRLWRRAQELRHHLGR